MLARSSGTCAFMQTVVPRWSALLAHLMRLVVIGAAFTLCARQGALPLLSSLAGFQIVRTVAVNQQRRALERNS